MGNETLREAVDRIVCGDNAIRGMAHIGFTKVGMHGDRFKFMIAGALIVDEPIWIPNETYGKIIGPIQLLPQKRWTTDRLGLGAEGVCMNLTNEEIWRLVQQ